MHLVTPYVYISPPLIMSNLGSGKAGLIRGVASCEGYIEYYYTEFVLMIRDSGLIRGGGLWLGWPQYRGITVSIILKRFKNEYILSVSSKQIIIYHTSPE